MLGKQRWTNSPARKLHVLFCRPCTCEGKLVQVIKHWRYLLTTCSSDAKQTNHFRICSEGGCARQASKRNKPPLFALRSLWQKVRQGCHTALLSTIYLKKMRDKPIKQLLLYISLFQNIVWLDRTSQTTGQQRWLTCSSCSERSQCLRPFPGQLQLRWLRSPQRFKIRTKDNLAIMKALCCRWPPFQQRPTKPQLPGADKNIDWFITCNARA